MNNIIEVINFVHPDNDRVMKYYSDSDPQWDERLIWALFEEPEYAVLVPACSLACEI